MEIEKTEKRRAKDDITGNCWHDRHHTCKGYGRTYSEGSKSVEHYNCKCKCHSTTHSEVEA